MDKRRINVSTKEMRLEARKRLELMLDAKYFLKPGCSKFLEANESFSNGSNITRPCDKNDVNDN